MMADSLCLLGIDLLDPLPLRIFMSVLRCFRLCVVRGKLQPNPDYRLVRGCFQGRIFSAQYGPSFSELCGCFCYLVLAKSCCSLEDS